MPDGQVAGISHWPEPEHVDPCGQQWPSPQSASPGSHVYPQPPLTLQYVVPEQQAVPQHALGIVVIVEPQHPPGEHMNIDPSEQVDEFADIAVPTPIVPRCIAMVIIGPPRYVPVVIDG
jgi:hypothetical protein